jgi:hypothetical protein
MANDVAMRFRERARACRDLADEAGRTEWRSWLLDTAKDLEDEADEIDSEEIAKRSVAPVDA